MNAKGKAGAKFSGNSSRAGGLDSVMKARGFWRAECRRPDGSVKWSEEWENLVVNAGLNYLLDAGLSGGTPVTTWYVGLLSATPTVAAGDTMGSHGGWTEYTSYDESVRQTWTDGGVSSQSVSNTASKAVFTGSTNGTTLGGAFLTSDSTKSGTTGTLYAAGAFSTGNKTLDDGETITIEAIFTMADDGV